jgi:sensor histidine kinase regulating citrate/malate metabolism
MEKKQNEKKKKELSFDVKIIGLIAALCILLIMIIAVPLSSSIRGQQ